MTDTRDRTDVGTDGRTVGPYRLISLLGRGGMGEVHRAYDTRRGRDVALKLLPQNAAGESFRARFRREADVAAGLREPHIVPIHDFGEIDGRLFIDMRLIDGMGLDSMLRHGPLQPEQAVALVGQVAQALNAAHAQGLVHRDVKPSNILVTSTGFAYLVDFGIARAVDDEVGITTTGSAIGTAAYMAPERFDGGTPDLRSDVYSLACVLAECLMGRRPFEATSMPGQMKAHLLTEPPQPSVVRPEVSTAFDLVVATGMAKKPAARFASAIELADAAQTALLHRTDRDQMSTGPSPVTLERLVETSANSWMTERSSVTGAPVGSGRWIRHSRAAIISASVAVVIVIGVAAFGFGRMSSEGAPSATSVPTTAPTVAAAPPTSSSGSGASPRYTYTVDSNYPVTVNYTDERGDQISNSDASAPWRLEVGTTVWGADQKPIISVSSSSMKGDTWVSCTISDADGKVLATDRKDMSYAAASCLVF